MSEVQDVPNNDVPQKLDPTEQATIKVVRRTGYAVFLVVLIVMVIPMLVGVLSGISNNTVWDPFTGQKLRSDAQRLSCPEEAQQLVVHAAHLNALSGDWERRYRLWVTRCRGTHPEAFNIVRITREDLLAGKLPDDLDNENLQGGQ